MGHEAIGTIVAVGPGVEKFSVGDYVISPFTLSCGRFFNPLSLSSTPSRGVRLDGVDRNYRAVLLLLKRPFRPLQIQCLPR